MLYQGIYKDIFMQASGLRFCADLKSSQARVKRRWRNMASLACSQERKGAMKLRRRRTAVCRPSVAFLKQVTVEVHPFEGWNSCEMASVTS